MNKSNADAIRNFNPSSLKWVPLKAAGGAALGAGVSNAFAAGAASEPAAEIAMAASEPVMHVATETGSHIVTDTAIGEATGIGPIGIIIACVCGL